VLSPRGNLPALRAWRPCRNPHKQDYKSLLTAGRKAGPQSWQRRSPMPRWPDQQLAVIRKQQPWPGPNGKMIHVPACTIKEAGHLVLPL